MSRKIAVLILTALTLSLMVFTVGAGIGASDENSLADTFYGNDAKFEDEYEDVASFTENIDPFLCINCGEYSVVFDEVWTNTNWLYGGISEPCIHGGSGKYTDIEQTRRIGLVYSCPNPQCVIDGGSSIFGFSELYTEARVFCNHSGLSYDTCDRAPEVYANDTDETLYCRDCLVGTLTSTNIETEEYHNYGMRECAHDDSADHKDRVERAYVREYYKCSEGCGLDRIPKSYYVYRYLCPVSGEYYYE